MATSIEMEQDSTMDLGCSIYFLVLDGLHTLQLGNLSATWSLLAEETERVPANIIIYSTLASDY